MLIHLNVRGVLERAPDGHLWPREGWAVEGPPAANDLPDTQPCDAA